MTAMRIPATARMAALVAIALIQGVQPAPRISPTGSRCEKKKM